MQLEPSTSQIPTDVAPGRRTFLGRVTCVLGAVAAAVAGSPCVGYFLGSRRPPVQWVDLGPVKDFLVDETRMVTFDNPLRQPWDGITAETGVYVRYQGPNLPERQQFLVFAVNCAHLGCPVSWFPQSGLFMCPCHGGVYYANGARASGPPPRGLFHCLWRVQGGHLEVQAPHYPTLQDTLETPV
jgi:menaquinol-cytochrome c reductase iron-sulfur subunit